MTEDPFYKAHWRQIEPGRLSGYRESFHWNKDAETLYEPACIVTGQSIADFGCGPGHIAVELARRVGPRGHIHAIDINSDFVSMVQENAQEAGVSDWLSTHLNDGQVLPIPDAALDRITARNTIMYVDDPAETLCEFHRVLRPGGLAHAIDGDWYAIVAEPIGHDEWRKFIEAASHACRNADMGRKLLGCFRRSKFSEVKVAVRTLVDTDGDLLGMVKNMAKYAVVSGSMPEKEVNTVVSELEKALNDGDYLITSTQFIVTGQKTG